MTEKLRKNSKAVKAVGIIDRAFALEREARKANVPPEKILEMRQKEVRPIIEEFYNFIGTLRPSKGSHLGAAVTYALNQKDRASEKKSVKSQQTVIK